MKNERGAAGIPDRYRQDWQKIKKKCQELSVHAAQKLIQLAHWIKKKSSAPAALGLHLEEDTLHCSLVVKHVNQFHVLCSTSILLSSKEALQSALHSLYPDQPIRITTGLEQHEVVLRTFQLPLKDKRKALHALPFQLEAILPFAPDQAVTSVFLTSIDAHITHVSVFASSKDLLKKHLNLLSHWDIHPDATTCTPLALFRLAHWMYPEQKDLLVFDFGMHKIGCIVIQEGQVVLSQSIRIGKADLVFALKSAYMHTDPKELEALFLSGTLDACAPIAAFNEKLGQELERFAIFIKEKIPAGNSSPWLLLGELTSSESLQHLWKNVFGDCRLPLKAMQELSIPHLEKYCLPIGFALDALASDKRSIQWLQKEFTPQHHLSMRKKRGLIYASFCLALSALIGVSSTIALHKRTRTLSEKLHSYFSIANTSSLSLSEMEQELLKAEKALFKEKNHFPFFLTAPKAADVLAWISTHPALATADGLPKEGIDIKNMRYQLIKFPTIEDPTASYQAQVEIEFTATTPRLAREFHDSLLKGDRIVNAKKDVKWNARGNVYSVQFELNKSPL